MLTTVGVGQSEPGQERSQNEDRFLVDDRLGLYLVCDGIGGQPGGEEAAELAVREISRQLENAWPLLKDIRQARVPASFAVLEVRRALQHTNDLLLERDRNVPKRYRMGTTAVLLLSLGWQAIIAHVGDSRVYRLRNRRVEQLTRDHTVARKLADDGLLPEKEVSESRLRSVLTQSLGSSPKLQSAVHETGLAPGDRYLLCSDGLCDYLEAPSHWVRQLQDELTAIPRHLINLANHYDGSDNVTALVVEVLEGTAHPDSVPLPSRPVLPH